MTNNKDKKVLNVPNLRFPEFTGEWKKCIIGELTIKVGSGVTPRGGETVYKSEGHPFVRSQNVGLGHLILDDIAYIDEDTHQRQKNTELQLDDVLLNITGASIGRSALVNQQIVGGNVNQHVCIIRANKKLIPSFLCNFLLSQYGQKQIESFQAGGNRQGLNFEQIKSIKIGLPSVEEQKKIADLLLLIEQRITTQNKIIEDLKKLKSAIYQELFSNLQGEEKSLSELAEITKGQQVNGNQLNENGKYYVMNGGIMPSGYYDDYNTEAGTISISEGGNSCGYVQYNKSKFWSGGHCYTLHIKPTARISTLFLFHFLKWKEEDIMALRIGSGLPNIQKKDLSKVRIIVPTFDKQQRLIALLSTLQMKIEYEEMYTINLDKQKLHLLSQMFI